MIDTLKTLTGVLLLLLLPAITFCQEIIFVTPTGKEVPEKKVLGRNYSLLLLVKPWDGLTKKLLDKWEKFGRSFRGRVTPVVIFTDTKRATVNKYMENKRHTYRWFIDENGEMVKRLNPPLLPYTVLLSPQGKEIYHTMALRDDFMRLIASNPGRLLRELERKGKNGIPLISPKPDHGPWGPPEPKDETFEGMTK